MKWTVGWSPFALNQLAELWLAASDREAITQAVDEIDRQLRLDPLTQGESRTAGRRILFLPPLVVIFEVVEPDRKVSVLAVRRFGARA